MAHEHVSADVDVMKLLAWRCELHFIEWRLLPERTVQVAA